MMMPSIFRENLFDDLMNMDMFRSPIFGRREKNLMKTDIHEKEGFYHLDMDLPGFKKDQVQISLEDGYLTISAEKGMDKESEDKDRSYVRQERYTGSCQRSFFIGEDIKPEDMKATFENGILHLEFPKSDQKKVEESHRIMIE